MNIANQGFPATRADLNNALQALASNNSGTSAPSTTFANQWWYDTTNNKLYIRNEANNAWIEVAVLDQTNNEWQITTGVIQAKDSDGLALKTDDGTTRLFVKDSDGAIGIGTSSPDSPLEVVATNSTMKLTGSGVSSTGITFETNGVERKEIGIPSGSTDLVFFADGGSTAGFRLDSSKNVIFGADAVGMGTSSTVVGAALRGNIGYLEISRDASNPVRLNRLTDAGPLIDFALAGATAGSLGAQSGGVYLGTSDAGIFFNHHGGGALDAIHPYNVGSKTTYNGHVDIGGSVNKFKDTYLSGSMFSGKAKIGTDANLYSSGEITSISAGNTLCLGLSNTASASAALHIRNLHNDGGSGTRNLVIFQANSGNRGSITSNGSSVAYNTTSDYRLKENVTNVTDGITRLKQLEPKRFNFIADADTTVDGFIAHEVSGVVPEAVTGTKDGMMDEEYEVTAAKGDVYTPAKDAVLDEEGNELSAATDEVIHSSNVEYPDTLEDGQGWRETAEAVMDTRSIPDYQGIDQAKIVPLLTAALQEAIAKIETLETKVAALEG
mgnify:FL=1